MKDTYRGPQTAWADSALREVKQFGERLDNLSVSEDWTAYLSRAKIDWDAAAL